MTNPCMANAHITRDECTKRFAMGHVLATGQKRGEHGAAINSKLLVAEIGRRCIHAYTDTLGFV